jgi:hypothetical protein
MASAAEIGAAAGICRQNANPRLKRLEKKALQKLQDGRITIVDFERFRSYGE